MSAELTPAHGVGVVGSGAVGQVVATTLVAAGFCDQLIISSRTLEQATSMAADLDDMRLTLGSPTCPRAAPTAGLQDCQVVVVAARARFTNTNDTGSVIGEHGDTLVVCASSTTVNGEAVRVPVDQVRAALLTRSGQISCGVGRTRSGPAGAVLSTLRLLLGLADGVEELCSPYRRGWLGLPVSFTGGHARVRVPPLDHEETRCLQASEAKLHAAYGALTERLHSLDHPQIPQ